MRPILKCAVKHFIGRQFFFSIYGHPQRRTLQHFDFFQQWQDIISYCRTAQSCIRPVPGWYAKSAFASGPIRFRVARITKIPERQLRQAADTRVYMVSGIDDCRWIQWKTNSYIQGINYTSRKQKLVIDLFEVRQIQNAAYVFKN